MCAVFEKICHQLNNVEVVYLCFCLTGIGKLIKLFASLGSGERSFHNLIEEGRNDYSKVVFSKKVGVY